MDQFDDLLEKMGFWKSWTYYSDYRHETEIVIDRYDFEIGEYQHVLKTVCELGWLRETDGGYQLVSAMIPSRHNRPDYTRAGIVLGYVLKVEGDPIQAYQMYRACIDVKLARQALANGVDVELISTIVTSD